MPTRDKEQSERKCRWVLQWPIRCIKQRKPAVENLSMFGSFTRMGPVGLILYAEHYLDAAKCLPEPPVPFTPVRHYLACHSIELALKALLSLKGETLNTLADEYSHDLKKLEKQADGAGLGEYVSLPADMRACIRKASLYYKGKLFEYPRLDQAVVAYPHLPDLTVLLSTAELLTTSLHDACLNA